MRLSRVTAAALPPSVARPGYDRDAQVPGIVHFGIGAFHRAHQAVYTDTAMAAGDRDWMIRGVSLRSAGVAEQMNPQDGLYTVTQRSAEGTQTRLIGAVSDVIVARAAPDAVIAALAAPETRIVTFTITEKGYCRRPDGGLDATLADDDSVFRYLRDGLARRRDAGLSGLTLLSCDNLAGNGERLRALLSEYLGIHAPILTEWVERNCTFPSSMIDRIVPATSAADRAAIAAEIGMADEAAVVTEPFSQWIIEDRFAGDRPRWDLGGAQFVADVAPYETAKLRMLNGAHSALAYMGLAAGHEFVHQAIGDPRLHAVIERLMRDEAATSFTPAAGQDLSAYADELLARFANPALEHRLIQIAMDGSQKIPQRWLETLAAQATAGRSCPSILQAVAAWLLHVRGDGHAVDDPQAAALALAWRQAGEGGIVEAMFGPGGLVRSEWRPSASDIRAIGEAIA